MPQSVIVLNSGVTEGRRGAGRKIPRQKALKKHYVCSYEQKYEKEQTYICITDCAQQKLTHCTLTILQYKF